jgi:hypothetical protein
MSDDDLPTGIPAHVIHLFEKLTLGLIAQGFQRYSARAILHQIRWHYQVDVGMRDFKCNNNWSPRMARWFLKKHNQEDFFELRASPSRHDMTDYDGPYDGKPAE